jgi:hypothetical protein
MNEEQSNLPEKQDPPSAAAPNSSQPAPSPKRRKNYIPRQKQVTPEIEARQEQEYRKRRKWILLRNKIRNWTFSLLLVLAVVGAIVGYIYLPQNNSAAPEIPTAPALQPKNSTPESLITSDSSSDIKAAIAEINLQLASGRFKQLLLTLSTKKQLAERLIELDQDEESVSFGVSEKFVVLIAMVTLSAENHLEMPEIGRELMEFSSEYASSNNPEIASYANLGILITKLSDLLANDTAENFEAVKSQMQDSLSDLSPSLGNQVLASNIILRELKNTAQKRELQQMLANYLIARGNSSQQKIGRDLYDQTVVGTVDYGLLRQMIAQDGSSAITDLKQLVESIASSPGLSASPYLNVLAVLERLPKPKKNSIEQGLLDKLDQSAASLTDTTARELAQELLEKYKARRKLIGTRFRLDNGAPAEQNLDSAAKTTVVAFVDLRKDGRALRAILEAHDVGQYNEQYVIVSVNQEDLEPAKRQQIESVFPGASFIWPTFNQAYLEQCQPTLLPYILLVDQDSIVVDLDADPENLRKPLRELNQPKNGD